MGALTEIEKETIEKFADIHKKYSFGSKTPLFSSYLTQERNILEHFQSILPNEDADVVTNTLQVFSEKFETIWAKDKKALEKWRDDLNITFSSKNFFNQEIIQILSRLYRRKNHKFQEVFIYPVFSGDAYYLNASAYRDESSVIFPLSRISLEKKHDIVAVIWHEFIHLYFDHIWLLPLLQKEYREEDFQRINEITAATLFPSGILGQRYFNQSQKANLYDRYITPRQGQQSLKLMRKYIGSDSALDEEYVKSLASILGA